MPLSKQISQYTDVHQIMETALAHSGVIYTLATPGQATYFRMRCYYYRKLLHAELEKRTNKPVTRTKFDTLQIEIDKDEPTRLFFRTESSPMGQLSSEEGKPLSPSLSTPEDFFIETPEALREAPSDLEAFTTEFLKSQGITPDEK